jgi:type IV pilus assembly protein PilV
MSTLEHTNESPVGPHPQTGFTLVEVLVALVVMSIGLLGIAKLVMYSAHSNDSAYMRSQATELAYEILDNMRANRSQGQLTAGGYNTPLSAGPGTAPASCLGVGAGCTAAQLAAYDIYQWKRRLDAATGVGALPSGKGQVVVAATTPATVTISVQWDDTVAQAAIAGTGVGVAAPMAITLETIL